MKVADTEYRSEFIRLGDPSFDVDAFLDSESNSLIQKQRECMNMFPDEDAAGAYAYWQSKGLVKRVHDPQDYEKKWASYVPVSYQKHQEPDKKYPVIFVLHGANNPIYLAESYGYIHIAAREEIIAAIPETETDENIDRIYEYLVEHYPVDKERVYIVGYSLGGFMAGRLALHHPERYAGTGIGGMLFLNGEACTVYQNEICWPGEKITDEVILRASEYGMAVCQCIGENEMLDLVPIIREPRPTKLPDVMPDGRKPAIINLTAENKVASVNNWRKISGCEPVSFESAVKAVEESVDPVIQKIGFPFERTKVLVKENREHFIADAVNADGNSTVRFICIGKAPHWPTSALVELTWSYISRFRRCAETGRLICTD